MQTEIIMKDKLRADVEAASGGKQTVLYTPKGQASYFNIVAALRLEELGLGVGLHPACVVNGVEKAEAFIGTYQAVIRDGEALSLPGQVPTRNVTFDQANAACITAGHHLMTNWEWALVALGCASRQSEARGNTGYGCSHSHTEEKGTLCNNGGMVLTGSGPAAWRHDGTPYGIADLNGNVWEWVGGLKLVGGHIIMPSDNNYALPESQWPDTGACIDMIKGCPAISDKITKRGWNSTWFRDTASKESYEVPLALKQALLSPTDNQLPGRFYADNSAKFEALPIRGGDWCSGSSAGLGALNLLYGRSVAFSFLGFRPAFIA